MNNSTLLILLQQKLLNIKSNGIDIDTTLNSNFLIAILAGVILAITFRFILTILSTALGISMIGDLKEKFVTSQVEPSDDNGKYEYNQDYDYDTPISVKVTTGVGVWSVVTSIISLFLATALALNMVAFSTTKASITIALVIWALFFLISFWLETKFLGALFGGLVNVVTSGFGTITESLKGLFTPSEATKVNSTIEQAITKIRTEFEDSVSNSDIPNTISKFFTKVENKLPSYDLLKSDLHKIMKDTQDTNTSGKWMAVQQVLTKYISKKEDSNGDLDNKKGQLSGLLNELKDTYNNSTIKTDAIKNIASDYTDLSQDEIDQKIETFENFFSKSDKKMFTTENIANALNEAKTLFSNTSDSSDTISLKQIEQLIAQNTNLNENEIEAYKKTINDNIKSLKKTLNSDIENYKTEIDESVKIFFNSTERDELNYDDLKQEFFKILYNPKDSLPLIKSRFDKFDLNTLKSILTKSNYIDESNIDNALSTLDQTKNEILGKVKNIEDKATKQFEMTKRKAVIQSEHARQMAAAAAWWLLSSAFLSAFAAVAGVFVEI